MRLIDADEFLQGEIKRCKCVPSIGSCDNDSENLKQILVGQPAIDPIRAAGGCRCRECVKFNTEDCPMVEHEFICPEDTEATMFTANNEDGFCNYGVRREGEK